MTLAVDPKRDDMRKRRLIAAVILGIPVSVFALFAVAEGFGGEAGWWGHLTQLAFALVIGAVAWIAPRIGGPLVVATGVALTAWLFVTVDDTLGALSTAAVIALPIVVSGVLFTLVGFSTRRHPRG